MAERLRPFPLRIRDALFTQIEKIGVDDETKWHTVPKTKALHNGKSLIQMIEAAKPALYLRTGSKTQEPGTNDQHKDTLELVIYCVSEDAGDPEAALWLLMADVERCLRENYTGQDELADHLETGYLLDLGSEPHMEEVAGKGGLGFGIVRASAHYQSDDIDT